MIPQPPPKPDPNTYWVVPGKLLAGEYPGARGLEEARRRLRKFLDVGVLHFIDLTEPGELEPYDELLAQEAGSKATYERIPIRDVSVHCWGGVGRTGLAVACWLQERGQTPDEALTNLADRWRSSAKSMRKPRSPETAEQMEWVKKWPAHRSTLNLK